ncbi:MAG TPA: LamG domain-containing protein, partial [Armatimonadota bacterium]|nr:LamG domain-containing protein [Armatimonadota bacterium]
MAGALSVLSGRPPDADGQRRRDLSSGGGGKRLEWTPGEWHHVAGTWRAKGLEIYVDGEREAFVPNPPMPDALGETFRLGDHPWHVPREKQTLIDEVKLYSAPLDPESIARAARGEAVEFKPDPIIELTVDPDANALTVACDAAGVDGKIVGKVELATEGRVVASGEITEFADQMGQGVLSLAGAEQGEYEVVVELVDGDGEALASKTERFAVPGPPVWSGNELGRADVVLPPWTPLEADEAEAKLACWGREYDYETFL